MTFEYTSEMVAFSEGLWTVTSAIGAGLCFLVLAVIGMVSIHPKARTHLDRVSFRIVVYALFANMIFGIACIVDAKRTHPGFICGFSVFILLYTLQFSGFLLFCIALNLQLVVVHGLNGQAMEKFYVAIPALLAVIVVVPPYASGQYGWDPLEQGCWYTNINRVERLIWQVATQLGWTALTVLGEVICSSIVLMFVLRHTGRTRRIFVPVRSMSETTFAPQVFHVHRYRYIIFRVALYPIASCFVNLLTITSTLHSSVVSEIKHRSDYNILLMGDFIYGGRCIIYALLAASDPALVRGVRTLFSIVIHRTEAPLTSLAKSTHTELIFRHPTEAFVELDTVKTGAPIDAGASSHESSSGIISSNNKMDTDQDHRQSQNPPAIDVVDLMKPSLDDHPPTAVHFAEGGPTLPAIELQERDRGAQEAHRDDDAFKKQI